MYSAKHRYTKEHEWIQVDGDTATVGITHHAQDQLGDVVFVELPDVGTQIQSAASFGTVESVKAVSDLFAPVSGEVLAVNEALVDEPEKVNSSPHDDGWIIKIKLTDKGEVEKLMTAEQYEGFLAGGDS